MRNLYHSNTPQPCCQGGTLVAHQRILALFQHLEFDVYVKKDLTMDDIRLKAWEFAKITASYMHFSSSFSWMLVATMSLMVWRDFKKSGIYIVVWFFSVLLSWLSINGSRWIPLKVRAIKAKICLLKSTRWTLKFLYFLKQLTLVHLFKQPCDEILKHSRKNLTSNLIKMHKGCYCVYNWY